MSKRFGRNQKRRLNAELAELNYTAKELEHKVKAHKDRLYFREERLNALEQMLEDLTRFVSEFSIALPPKERLKIDEYRDSIRCVMHSNTPIAFRSLMTESIGRECSLAIETLQLIDVHYEVSPLNRVFHAFVNVADKRLVYSVSESAFLYKGDERKRLFQSIGQQLAFELERQFRVKGPNPT